MSTTRAFPTRKIRRRALLSAAVFTSALALPTGANAANVSFGPEFPALSATYIAVTDPDGDANDLQITYQDVDGTPDRGSDRLVITDTDPLVLDEPAGIPEFERQCHEITSFEIRCRVPVVDTVTAHTGGGDDKVTFLGPSPLKNVAFAGAGDDEVRGGPAAEESLSGDEGEDRLYGSDAPDSLSGGSENDTLEGRGGEDYLAGGLHDDVLRGDGGPDRMVGGPGIDTATYSDRAAHITADLQGDDGDGAPGEGDEIAADVEGLHGGSASDLLSGNNGPNRLTGGAGDDTLRGAGGADVFDGSLGSDTVSYSGLQVPIEVSIDAQAGDGTAGENDEVKPSVENLLGGMKDDTLRGSAAENRLNGGAGADTIEGRGGTDELIGGAGSDTILAKDQLLDHLSCGTEIGSLAFDAGLDKLTADCLPLGDDPIHPPGPGTPDAEPDPGTNPGTTPGTDPGKDGTKPQTGPALRIGAAQLRMSRGGLVRIKVSCPSTAQGRCQGTLRLVAGKRTLARGRVSVPAGKRATLRLKVARRLRRTVGGRARRIAATASVRDSVSSPRTSSRALRLRKAVRPRR